MKELDLILKNIKNKELLPVYFFHGEEPYFIDVALKAFEDDVLSEDEKAFGQTVVYGKETTITDVVALAQQFPMFGSHNLIIVKEAQELRYTEEERRVLERYLQNPVETTILVFGHKKKLAANLAFSKILSKNKWLFQSETIKDHNVPKWIADQFQLLKIKSAPNISYLLAEYLGTDLSRIANELNKLKILLKDDEVLDAKMVERHIGISKEYNVFELQKALGTKNGAAAMKIAHYMGKNLKSEPLPKILGSMYSYFSNIIMAQTLAGESPQTMASEMGISPYFVKDYAAAGKYYPFKMATRIISMLREADMKSKGLGANQMEDSEILTELIYKILNVDKLKVKT